MRISNKWRVGMWLFLVLILTVSSVALTITFLGRNIQKVQSTAGKDDLENDSLSRHPFSFPQELTAGRIDKNIYVNAYAEDDAVVDRVVTQYLQVMTPAEGPRYRTDIILGIEDAVRTLTSVDQEIIKSLNAELNANPSSERRRAIEAELKRIHEETTSRAGTDQVTTYR